MKKYIPVFILFLFIPIKVFSQSIDVKLNIYWNVNSSVEERNVRQELLLDIARFAKERKIDFFEPRVRSNR